MLQRQGSARTRPRVPMAMSLPLTLTLTLPLTAKARAPVLHVLQDDLQHSMEPPSADPATRACISPTPAPASACIAPKANSKACPATSRVRAVLREDLRLPREVTAVWTVRRDHSKINSARMNANLECIWDPELFRLPSRHVHERRHYTFRLCGHTSGTMCAMRRRQVRQRCCSDRVLGVRRGTLYRRNSKRELFGLSGGVISRRWGANRVQALRVWPLQETRWDPELFRLPGRQLHERRDDIVRLCPMRKRHISRLHRARSL